MYSRIHDSVLKIPRLRFIFCVNNSWKMKEDSGSEGVFESSVAAVPAAITVPELRSFAGFCFFSFAKKMNRSLCSYGFAQIDEG
jgi:hypothetical protein